MCRQAGMDVKNQLSSLEPDQAEAILQLVKKGSKGGGTVATAAPAPAALPTDIDRKIKVLAPLRRPATAQPESPSGPTVAPPPLEAPPAVVAPSEEKPLPPPAAVPPVASASALRPPVPSTETRPV